MSAQTRTVCETRSTVGSTKPSLAARLRTRLVPGDAGDEHVDLLSDHEPRGLGHLDVRLHADLPGSRGLPESSLPLLLPRPLEASRHQPVQRREQLKRLQLRRRLRSRLLLDGVLLPRLFDLGRRGLRASRSRFSRGRLEDVEGHRRKGQAGRLPARGSWRLARPRTPPPRRLELQPGRTTSASFATRPGPPPPRPPRPRPSAGRPPRPVGRGSSSAATSARTPACSNASECRSTKSSRAGTDPASAAAARGSSAAAIGRTRSSRSRMAVASRQPADPERNGVTNGPQQEEFWIGRRPCNRSQSPWMLCPLQTDRNKEFTDEGESPQAVAALPRATAGRGAERRSGNGLGDHAAFLTRRRTAST